MRMTLHRGIRFIWKHQTPAQIVLTPLSWLFAIACRIRECILKRKQKPFAVPVIVIGNISVGGNGKTSMVIALANALKQRGHHVGIVSRGYRRTYTKTTILMNHDMDATFVGDEAKLIWQKTHCLVCISGDRSKAAKLLIENKCDIILSDDGLQRYDFYRDIEISVTASKALGNGKLLPAGPLRERKERLAQCDFQIELDQSADTVNEIDSMAYEIERIESLDGKKKTSISELKQQQHSAICALGNPDSFFELLGKHGISHEEIPLPDHDKIDESLLQKHNQSVLITEKDAIKISNQKHHKHVWVIKIKPIINKNTLEKIIRKISNIKQKKHQVHH